MTNRARLLGVLLPLAILALLLALSAPPWPDDWDGLGFVGSITRFDLDAFTPHPPGYPVYVALLKAAAVFFPRAMVAANAVAVASGVASITFLAAAAGRGWGLGVGGAVAASPLVWHCISGVGSEAPALAFAAFTLWAATRQGPHAARWLGLAAGLGVGVRTSWAPLFVPMLLFAPRGERLRAGAYFAAAMGAWALPLLAVVGPRHYLALLATHLSGHAQRWGGTALTEPARARFLLRDLLVDGLGAGGDFLGLAIGALAVVVGVTGVLAWRRAGWKGAGRVALLLAPYLAWVAVGQNLREQPRHVLPLVVALSSGLAAAALADRRARLPAMVLLGLVGVRTAKDAVARRTIPPPGAQLVELVRTLPNPARVAVFGTASVRFFEPTELAARAFNAGTLGDVVLTLGRLPELPARVLVTGEIPGLDASPYAIEPLATFCRPARLDRRAPCLAVSEVRLPYLPKE